MEPHKEIVWIFCFFKKINLFSDGEKAPTVVILYKGTSYKPVHHTHSRSCVPSELIAEEDTQGSSWHIDTGVEMSKNGIEHNANGTMLQRGFR